MQFALAPEELWKSNTLFRDEHRNKPMWASERVMPFGIFPASGIAQRKAYAQMELVWIEFDKLEAPIVLSGFLARWTAQRKELGLSTRLAFGKQYTDDVCVVVLGVARMVRFIRAWHTVISSFNILMAPPKKRQLGCAATWLGAILAPATGAVTTPMSKRLRAIEMLRLLLAEKLTLGQLAKLNGLLEHLCDVFCLPRSAMFHMYEPMQTSVVLHPDFEFVPSKHLVKQTASWLLRLAKVAGSRCGQMLVTPWKATESTRLLHWYSDAAKEGCGRPGLGGWYSGYWWQWILPEGYEHLTIPLLEFMAVLVNIVVFGRLVLRGFHDKAFIVMHIDASASVTVLASGAPKSQPMQLVWEAISSRPEYQKLKKRLGAAHTFGPANLMADAASRDKRDVISRISAQMRLAAVELKVPSSLKESISKISQEIFMLVNKKAAVQRAVADLETNPVAAARSDYLIGAKRAACPDGMVDQQMSEQQLNHEVAASVLVEQAAVEASQLASVERQPSKKRTSALTELYSAEQSNGSALKPFAAPPEGSVEQGDAVQKLKEDVAAEWIADRLAERSAEWVAERSAHAASLLPTAGRPLTAAEQALDIGQANTPDSASNVMQRKLFKMLKLTPTNVSIELEGAGQPAGDSDKAVNRNGFGKHNLRRSDSGSQSKVARLAPITPIGSFAVARDVRESKSTLDTYASEAVKGMTASLFNDKSPYALQLGDEPVMREAVQSLFTLINDYVPTGTKSKDKSDWKWWEKMTARFGTRAWRDDALANLGYDRAGHFREIILQALVLVEVSKEMVPKQITRRQAGLKAKPGSAFGVLTSARRVHARFCIQMAKSPLVHLVLKSLLKRYIANHGLHALLPKRKEPFTREMIIQMLNLDPPTSKSNSYGPCDNGHDFMVVLVMLQILVQTGMRLSELIGTDDTCRPPMCWDSFIYLLENVLLHSLSSEQADSMDADSCVLLKVGTAKADPTGSHWAPFPVYLPYRGSEQLNAARAIRDLDQVMQVPEMNRRDTGVFVKRSGKRMARTYLVNTLDAMVRAVGKDPTQFSFHSARIWLACALKESGASNNRTQGMVRWLSEDSLRIYARDSRHTYAHWLDKAMQANVDAKQVANLPTLDDDNAWSQLQDWIKLPDDNEI